MLPQTRIALFPEGEKAAGEVEVGDLLRTRTLTGEPVGERVRAVRRSVQPCLALTTGESGQLLCSETHSVMVAGAHPERSSGRVRRS